ncbi:hypothetical protein ACO0LF_18720 [Undibacterium sp. Di27W]|uniref:hypothetical protein n=1 Tax=Undibacterium sp. Di27W TaxID=3413036 RepID=UPI003BF243D1
MAIKKNRNIQNVKNMQDKQLEDTAGFYFLETLLFIISMVIFIFVGEKAGMRFMGLLMLFFACRTLLVRRVPYGMEGQEPIGYLTGVPAVIAGVVELLLAGFVILRPAMVLDFFR